MSDVVVVGSGDSRVHFRYRLNDPTARSSEACMFTIGVTIPGTATTYDTIAYAHSACSCYGGSETWGYDILYNIQYGEHDYNVGKISLEIHKEAEGGENVVMPRRIPGVHPMNTYNYNGYTLMPCIP